MRSTVQDCLKLLSQNDGERSDIVARAEKTEEACRQETIINFYSKFAKSAKNAKQ